METDPSISSWLKRTWNETNDSVDKLAIIKRQDKNNQRAAWYLVQVDLDEANERRARKCIKDTMLYTNYDRYNAMQYKQTYI